MSCVLFNVQEEQLLIDFPSQCQGNAAPESCDSSWSGNFKGSLWATEFEEGWLHYHELKGRREYRRLSPPIETGRRLSLPKETAVTQQVTPTVTSANRPEFVFSYLFVGVGVGVGVGQPSLICCLSFNPFPRRSKEEKKRLALEKNQRSAFIGLFLYCVPFSPPFLINFPSLQAGHTKKSQKEHNEKTALEVRSSPLLFTSFIN